ncbi:MAG: NrsF family protein [Siculibacillus sp.]
MIRTSGPSHEETIGRLVDDLRPVRRARSPLVDAFLWIAAVAALALVLAPRVDFGALTARLSAAPDMWMALAGSTTTMILAAFATFMLGLPDRDPRWSLAPLPGLALWLGASGSGCLRAGLESFGPIPAHEIIDCFAFIVGFSVPLSGLMFVLRRRAYSLRPTLNAAIAGLAASAAAASLLTLVHPFDATVLDLGVHFVAVGIVVASNGLVSRRFAV